MRKKILILGVVCMVLSPIFCAAADTQSNEPEAFLPDSIFEFKPVMEGTQVAHEFILHNRGDAPLAILDIKSG